MNLSIMASCTTIRLRPEFLPCTSSLNTPNEGRFTAELSPVNTFTVTYQFDMTIIAHELEKAAKSTKCPASSSRAASRSIY